MSGDTEVYRAKRHKFMHSLVQLQGKGSIEINPTTSLILHPTTNLVASPEGSMTFKGSSPVFNASAHIKGNASIDGNIALTGNLAIGGNASLDTLTLELGSSLSNKQNADVDTGTETVDSFADTAGDGAIWFYRVKKGANLRLGTIFASWDASGNTIIASEGPGTQDVGDTTGLTFDVDISSNVVRLRATATSDDWAVRVIRFLI